MEEELLNENVETTEMVETNIYTEQLETINNNLTHIGNLLVIVITILTLTTLLKYINVKDRWF